MAGVFWCVPSKTTTLVHLTIVDLLWYFWTELPTWPDTLLKTLTKHLCFWWSRFASDEFTASIFKVTELVQADNEMMEWNKICHLYRKSVQIRLFTVPKGWEVHPSKTLYYLITTCRKKPKNDHRENLKSYYLHLHRYASWWGTILYVAQWLTIRWMVWVQIPVELWFFVAIWTSPKVHPASST
jgi:hypothetical protein